ncbi:MAG: hypothetical protein JWN04_6790 [Myxococcaceae bacterium]|nr:hypothetical protein [Myxococcaceae bacterium]
MGLGNKPKFGRLASEAPEPQSRTSQLSPERRSITSSAPPERRSLGASLVPERRSPTESLAPERRSLTESLAPERRLLPLESFTPGAIPENAYGMRARGTILVGFRHALVDIYGAPGLASVAERLPVEVRYDTIDSLLVNTEWLPEAHVMAWYEALWLGPCKQTRSAFEAVIDRMMDFGFGRIRKALLALADPSVVVVKAGTLWRYDHTHGELTVEADDKSARLRLEHHPYAENPLSCLATAEVYRYCAALCRVRNVVASHYREASGALIVRVRWDR